MDLRKNVDNSLSFNANTLDDIFQRLGLESYFRLLALPSVILKFSVNTPLADFVVSTEFFPLFSPFVF